MSKIICDVCGTTYAETATQCPICGCARATTAQTAAEGTAPDENTYSYVKGGRFSKSNVRKRNKTGKDFQRQNQESQKPQKQPKPAKEQEPEEGSNKILVAIVIVLLLAIVAVAAYIGIRFFLPDATPNLPGQTQNTKPSTTTITTTAQKIPCTEIKLSVTSIEFAEEGEVRLLNVEKIPADTTDDVLFHSSNPEVATVDANGKITAVGGGDAIITVVCGSARLECKVVCAFGEIVPPTTAAPTVPVVPGFVLKLNRTDFTLSKEGESWTLYKETDGVKPTDITWTIDDENVATVDNKGKVTGVNRGDTKVHATYGDQTVECWVRVRFDKTEVDPDALKLNTKDATIQVGETFRLNLTDSQGVNIEVEFTASEEGFVEISGNKIKGVAHTWDLPNRYITVSCTYDGETYTCIIRIPKPEEPTE